ncbi:MAG: VOC family protein [Gemmataceae bacterium]
MPVMTKYEHGQFSWVDLMAHDMTAAKEFYMNFFGWDCVESPNPAGLPYGMFKLNGHDVGGIGQTSEEMKAAGVPPMWNNYINVDDVEAVVNKAVELGGEVIVPVTQVMESGSLAFIKDPTGGVVGFWQPNEHCGATLVNDPNTFCWNEFNTPDIEKAKDFFGKLLGWEFELNSSAPNTYYIIKVGENQNGGLLQMTEEWQGVPPHWMVYFTTSDIQASVAKWSELGGQVCIPPFDIPIGKICVVTDPQGAALSLFEFAKTPA